MHPRPTDRPISIALALRSLCWAILLPGVVAGYLPWRYFGLREARFHADDPRDLVALALLLLGLVLLGACILEFARSGRGTLAPVDPPRHLVVQGLYRHVRNPMYLGVALILAGELLLIQSRSLGAFAVCFFVAVNLFVLGYEEPRLRSLFGGEYEKYCRRVPRWIPSLKGSDPPGGEPR